ncbi:MAG TPA: D-alanyl-D-alanine carboxypeptidase family protein [Microvirga sp.]|jgi:D-alanyl-D-alanine carboxypeptidase
MASPFKILAQSRVLALSLAALVASGGAALANGPALVMDAATGQVLHAERATDPWYPASITKLMTAYVALEMIKQGQATPDRLLTVSEEAAALPPSKMAFKPGTQIRLDNALKIIMVKSANDVAATIAEGLGGSVEGFSAHMNAAAAKLGMRESQFVNPHGLPDDRQWTSARDMAILARALYREFPEHQDLFDIGAIQFGRRVMRNHNGLIGRYPGADGMKTGFICASGFNVVASATRGGRRLITVVLGSSSANERTLKAADLFERGFAAQGASGLQPEQLQTSALSSPPNMRPVICDRRGPMPGEDDGGGMAQASADSGMPNLLGANVMAFAGAAPAPMPRTLLGPRGPVVPVKVWIGPTPPSEAEIAAQAAAEEAEEAARLAARKGKKAVARGGAKAPAQEAATQLPAGAIPEGKDGRASLTLKPVTGTPAPPARAAARPAEPKAAEPKAIDVKATAGKAADAKAPAKLEAKPEAKPGIVPAAAAAPRKPEPKKPAAAPAAGKPLDIKPAAARVDGKAAPKT